MPTVVDTTLSQTRFFLSLLSLFLWSLTFGVKDGDSLQASMGPKQISYNTSCSGRELLKVLPTILISSSTNPHQDRTSRPLHMASWDSHGRYLRNMWPIHYVWRNFICTTANFRLVISHSRSFAIRASHLIFNIVCKHLYTSNLEYIWSGKRV